MTNIIITPTSEKLRDEVQSLRNRIIQLLQERDHLMLVECPGIEARYMSLVGGLEAQGFREELAYRRTRRKLEMLQALVNRREPIDREVEERIEQLLDEELSAFQQRLDDRLDALNRQAARGRDDGSTMVTGTEEEIRRLYLQVVKALHPDLHPEQSEQEAEMFHWAQVAYENRDLGALRTIAEAIRGAEDLPADMSGADLEQEQLRLADMVQEIREDIALIKKQYPYTMKELLNDAEWVRQRREELQGQIDDYVRIREEYEGRIREILRR